MERPLHPNIKADGSFCADELKWAPTNNMTHFAKFMQQIIASPNLGACINPLELCVKGVGCTSLPCLPAESPVEPDVANRMERDIGGFEREASGEPIPATAAEE